MSAVSQQHAAEAISRPTPAPRLTQAVLEALVRGGAVARLAQHAGEVAARPAADTASRRVWQHAAEALAKPAVNTAPRCVPQRLAEVLSRPAAEARLLALPLEVAASPAPAHRLHACLAEVLWREPPAPGVFDFRHDWSEPLRETWAWATNVIESNDGDESRIRLRARPLRRVEIAVLESGPGSVSLDGWLAANQGRLVWLPLWRAGRGVAAPAAAGDARIALSMLDTAFARALQTATAAGVGPVLLLDPDGDAQQAWVADIDAHAGALILREPLARAVPLGARCTPLILARCLGEVDVTRLAGGVSGASVAFEAAPAWYVHAYTPPADQMFEGLPILEARNWASEHAIRHAARVDTLDNGIAAVWSARRHDRQGRVFTWSATAQGDVAIGRLLGLLETLAGRLAECWLADELTGMAVTAPAAPGDAWLTVNRAALPAHLADPWRVLRVHAPGAPALALRMSGVASQDEAGARLWLAAPLAQAIPAGARVCGLKRCRQNQDEVSLIWRTDQALEVSVDFTELPEHGKHYHGFYYFY